MAISPLVSLLAVPALISGLISFLITKITIKVYTYFRWLDDPHLNSHVKTTHSQPVPRGGGIPIFITLLVVGYLFIGFSHFFTGILLTALVLTIIGIADDLFNINPYLRLLVGSLAALTIVTFGIGISYITNPFFTNGQVINLDVYHISLNLFHYQITYSLIADSLAIIWIVWLMNIVNWSKGLDGQMPGFVSIAALIIGILSLRFVSDPNQVPVTIISGITSGAFLGLLYWNKYPQQIMPGYGGGSLAGFLLAVLSILSGAKVAAMILILGIPIMDALFTIIRRIYSGKSPVWGDRGHLHHRLLDLGWSKPQIARFYWVSTLILGILALNLNSSQKFFTIIALALLSFGLLLWFTYLLSTIRLPKS